MKKDTWKTLIQIAISILTAIATAIFKVPKIQLLDIQYVAEMLN